MKGIGDQSTLRQRRAKRWGNARLSPRLITGPDLHQFGSR